MATKIIATARKIVTLQGNDAEIVHARARNDFSERHLLAGVRRLRSNSWFENSVNLPMTEEPRKFLMSPVRYARPIAERAGDAPPREP